MNSRAYGLQGIWLIMLMNFVSFSFGLYSLYYLALKHITGIFPASLEGFQQSGLQVRAIIMLVDSILILLKN